jgi:hypothetical protein
MTRKGAARSQHEPGLARTEETEDGTGRALRPAPRTKARGAETTAPSHGPISQLPEAGAPLPPPHPALVALVRLLARTDARRTRAEEKERRR